MADLVIPLSRFLALPSMRGTSDAVYARALEIEHGTEKHTAAEWVGLIDALRNQPVENSALRRAVPGIPPQARRR